MKRRDWGRIVFISSESALQIPAEMIHYGMTKTAQLYLKSIDLTRMGLAVPVVDELATIPLDLWARGHGYAKLQINLLGT